MINHPVEKTHADIVKEYFKIDIQVI